MHPAGRHADRRRALPSHRHLTEVDLVGTENAEGNSRVEFAGSVKWRARSSFGAADVDPLEEHAQHVPGWETTSLKTGVSRTGFAKDVDLNPDDVLAAWG